MNCKILVLAVTLCFEFEILYSIHGLSVDLNKRQGNFSIWKKTNQNANTKLNASHKRNTPTTSTLKANKKWNIGRMTSKQHGVVNILMPKTKLFINLDYSNLTCKPTTIKTTYKIQSHMISTASSPKQKAFKISTLREKLQTSTPSYIEFYYLDLSDDKIKWKNVTSHKSKNDNKSKIGRFNIRKSPVPSLFKIHVNTVPRKYPVMMSPGIKSVHKVGKGNIDRNRPSKSKPTNVNNVSPIVNKKRENRNWQSLVNKSNINKQSNNILQHNPINLLGTRTPVNVAENGNVTKPCTIKHGLSFNSYPKEVVVSGTNNSTKFATAYDKVKFFEMYDSYTPKFQNYKINNESNKIYDYDDEEKNFHIDRQIHLQNLNEDTDNHLHKNRTKFVQKHVNNLKIKEKKSVKDVKIGTYSNKQDLLIKTKRPNIQEGLFTNLQKNTYGSSKAIWSDFPFVAVYIYEPLQVRCDAAGISQHWLVAAALCLSKHQKELRGGDLSAFVTFCSEDWRNPQMISYVKRTLIHPLFRRKDRLRRHLFNAGLVQVVNSLDSCKGWVPVTLMSHQFTADQKETIGSAVGWGLDRYDARYAATNIPRHPLMKYEARVYSQTCPGNTEYSNAKSSDEDSIRNVYCLSLPPYLAEDNDTVHGALLLIGGKLLALYLQEERRSWGEQSGQYAGLWRLMPWLSETAREPDDTFPFEI